MNSPARRLDGAERVVQDLQRLLPDEQLEEVPLDEAPERGGAELGEVRVRERGELAAGLASGRPALPAAGGRFGPITRKSISFTCCQSKREKKERKEGRLFKREREREKRKRRFVFNLEVRVIV